MADADKPRSDTLRAVLRGVKPRPTLYAKLDVKSARAAEMLRGLDPGTTERLANIGGRILLPQCRGSERKAAMMVWTILKELHSSAFTSPAPDHTDTSDQAAA